MRCILDRREARATEIRRLGTRIVIGAAMSAALSACSVAPGMRMSSQATLPVTGGDESTSQQNLQIPITDINMALIQEMREAAQRLGESQLNDLVGKPEPYTLGVGDVLQITVWDHPELAAAQVRRLRRIRGRTTLYRGSSSTTTATCKYRMPAASMSPVCVSTRRNVSFRPRCNGCS
jgi:hypothetical protein